MLVQLLPGMQRTTALRLCHMFIYSKAVSRTGIRFAQFWKNLLGNIRQIKPTVNEVFLRSDSAGCYHNNNLIAAASNVGTSVGIKVIREVENAFQITTRTHSSKLHEPSKSMRTLGLIDFRTKLSCCFCSL